MKQNRKIQENITIKSCLQSIKSIKYYKNPYKTDNNIKCNWQLWNFRQQKPAWLAEKSKKNTLEQGVISQNIIN